MRSSLCNRRCINWLVLQIIINTVTSPTAVVCPSLSNPANGIVDLSQGTSLNAVATYSCNVGYRLEGTGQRTCGSEGGWSDTQPVCEGNIFGIHLCCTCV